MLTLITEDMLRRLDIPLQTTKTRAICASRKALNLLGECFIDLKIGPHKVNIKAHVVHHLTHNMLIGTDSMRKVGKFAFNHRNGYIEVNDSTKIPLAAFEAQEQALPVLALNTLTIPPNHEAKFPCTIRNDTEPLRPVLFESNREALEPRNLSAANSLNIAQNGIISVKFMNSTDKPQTIYKGMTIGNVETYLSGENSIKSVDASMKRNHDPLQDLNLDKADITKSQKAELLALFRRYASVFSTGDNDIGHHPRETHDQHWKSRPYQATGRSKPPSLCVLSFKTKSTDFSKAASFDPALPPGAVICYW